MCVSRGSVDLALLVQKHPDSRADASGWSGATGTGAGALGRWNGFPREARDRAAGRIAWCRGQPTSTTEARPAAEGLAFGTGKGWWAIPCLRDAHTGFGSRLRRKR